VLKREELLEGQASRQESVANQVRRETAWLGRKAAARTRKASSRIEDAARRREELEELKYRNAAAGGAAVRLAAPGRQTRKLLAAAGIAKALGGRALFSGLELTLSPGSRLGLLGPNGSGKSTLLRVLGSELLPDAGTVTLADGLRIVRFEQGRATLDPAVTLRRALCPNGDTLMLAGRPQHVVARAKQFLFRPEQLEVPVGSLSGGEQARVRLAQLMLQPADLLLLDEPTNDLDIPALEVLEDSLEEFAGALVLVSHDRELIDRLCTEVVGLDGRGGSGGDGRRRAVAGRVCARRRRGSEARSAAARAPRRPSTPAEAAQTRLPRAAGASGDRGCDPRRRAGRHRPRDGRAAGGDGRPRR